MKFKEIFFLVITICCVLGLPSASNEQCKKGSGGVGGFIVGGERAQKGDWRWVVAFKHLPSGNYFCGGSFISNRHVLSGKCELWGQTRSQKYLQSFKRCSVLIIAH
jgi:secreted trypsin-like serine protease